MLASVSPSSWQPTEKADIENHIRGILIQLDDLHETLKADSYPTDIDTILTYDFAYPVVHTPHSATPIAIAYHRAAQSLCLYILSYLDRSSIEEFREHCMNILKSAQKLFDGEVLHPSYWRHVLLLKIVAFAIPGKHEKEIAWGILEGWAAKTGLLGIQMRGQSSAWMMSQSLAS